MQIMYKGTTIESSGPTRHVARILSKIFHIAHSNQFSLIMTLLMPRFISLGKTTSSLLQRKANATINRTSRKVIAFNMSSSSSIIDSIANDDRPSKKSSSILDTIGKTPLVKLNRMAPEGVNVYVKCEAFNPMGSVKDRLALACIEV